MVKKPSKPAPSRPTPTTPPPKKYVVTSIGKMTVRERRWYDSGLYSALLVLAMLIGVGLGGWGVKNALLSREYFGPSIINTEAKADKDVSKLEKLPSLKDMEVVIQEGNGFFDGELIYARRKGNLKGSYFIVRLRPREENYTSAFGKGDKLNGTN